MSHQVFILSHILSEFENRIMGLNWYDLKIVLNKNDFKDDEVSIDIKVFDVNSNIYLNVNDKIRVNGTLISRSLPVESSFVIFVSSCNQKNQLKAVGIILQAFRDDRKMSVGKYNWLNNNNSLLSIDTCMEPDLNTILRLKEYWDKKRSLTLFFKINCCIDSGLSIDFVEVKKRKVHMEKING